MNRRVVDFGGPNSFLVWLALVAIAIGAVGSAYNLNRIATVMESECVCVEEATDGS